MDGVAVLAVTLDIVLTLCETTCVDYNAAITENVSMDHLSVQRISASSVYDCIAHCHTTSGCRSFTLDTKTRTCYLCPSTSNQSDVIPRPGFLFSDINHWPKSLAGPCAACPGGASCKVDRLGRASCEKDCDAPLSVSGAGVSSNGNFPTAVATYTCNDGYQQCHTSNTSVCQPTGVWTGVTGLCHQSRWSDPTQPFDTASPCGSRSRMTLLTKGRPTGTERIVVNLYNGTDILLHTVAYFDSKKFVVNTYFGQWGNHIDAYVFPLIVGETYEMRLSLQDGVFTCVVSNSTIFTFPERRAGAEVDRLSIEGGIQLLLVEIR